MATSSNSVLYMGSASLSHNHHNQPKTLSYPTRSHSVSLPPNKRSNSLTLRCSTNDDIPIELKFPEFPTVMNIEEIRDILPHRFPFLLVDRVIEYTPGVSAVAIKNVTINDKFFPGHFPDRPIMPGVLMIEAMAQVGGILMLEKKRRARDNYSMVGIDKVRFRKPVVAGDTLVMRMTLLNLQKGRTRMEGKAYVGDSLVCEAEFMMVYDGVF